jgi:acyl dehydratase
MFTMSLMTSLVMRPWYERGVRVVRIEAKLTKPVPVGQSLSCEGSVKELHPRGPGSDLVVVGVTAYDSEGDTVGVGSITVRLPA